MEVHFSQRLILGEWSWSLHRATENVATVPVCKDKNEENHKGNIKNPLASQCTQPVSATKNAEKRVEVKTAVEVLILKAQPQESPSLAAEKYTCQVCIGILLLLMSGTCISITAQQFG